MIETGEGAIIERVVKLVKRFAKREGMTQQRSLSKKNDYHSVRTPRSQRAPKVDQTMVVADGCRNIEVKVADHREGANERTKGEFEQLYAKYK